MSWPELLGQEILVRLPDNDIGFVYVVKYAGVTVRRGFVSAMEEDRGGHDRLFARSDAVENGATDGEEGDAR